MNFLTEQADRLAVFRGSPVHPTVAVRIASHYDNIPYAVTPAIVERCIASYLCYIASSRFWLDKTAENHFF